MAAVPENVEINAPERMTRAERVRDTVLTAMLWGFYLYLWAPLVSLFAWLLGVELAYDVMVRAGGLRGLQSEALGYLIVIMLIFAVVTAWSLGNRLRFRGAHDRRKRRNEAISDTDIARYFEVTPAQLKRLRAGSRLDITFRDGARGGSALSVRTRK